MQVEIWSDFACPFCYIGKRNFESALQLEARGSEVEVVYRSFELDPRAEKSQRVSIDEVLAKKYGRSVEWAHKMNENVTATARSVGLTFATDNIIPTNSFDAHRLNHLAARFGRQASFQDLVFNAYFTEGRDIASSEVLKSLAEAAGLPGEEVEELLDGDAHAIDVRNDEKTASEIGIEGVPFFLFDGTLAVSGAQPVEVFTDVFKEAFASSR